MRFRSDRRGQAIQIGAVLIFGILVVSFSLYQAFAVPNQNAEVEFNHYQDVERDMVDLRSEILQAKTTGEDRFTTVQLGTEFPERIVATNPPNPTGSLRTTDNKTIQVIDAPTGSALNLEANFDNFEPANRFVEYTPQYSAFQRGGTIRYENTVVYSDFRDANVTLSGQRLLRDDTISLVPVHSEFQTSGGQSAAVEPIPGLLESEQVENPNVTLETELGEDDWEALLSDQVDADADFDNGDITINSQGELELDLSGTYDLEYAPVGLDQEPLGGDRGGDSTDINPATPGNIRLEDEYLNGAKSEVKVVFNNTAEKNNVTEARISFYNSAESGNNVPEWANLTNGIGPSGTETQLVFGEAMTPLNEKVILGEGNSTVTLNFANNKKSDPTLKQDSWFVLAVTLETGERATYFISVPKD